MLPRLSRVPRRFAVSALVSALLLSVWAPAFAITKEQLDHAVLSTHKVFILNAQEKAIGQCSGTTIDPSGLILTNWHCVGLTSEPQEDDSGQGLRPGQLYHPNGLVVIAPTKDPKLEPVPTYVGQAVAGTPDLDMAVVKIVGMFDRKLTLPSNLPLVVTRSADISGVGLGDPVHVLGYPGIGGTRLNYSSGIVSGFDDRNEDGKLDSIKTNAEMAPGVSGGLALNDAGDQMGIPTWGVSEGAAKIDRMMMIDIAAPYVQQALGGATLAPTPAATPGGPSPVASPAPGRPAPSPSPGAGAKVVVIRGQVVDADTKRAISGASVGLLKAGVTFDQWERQGYSATLVVSEGATDRNGAYQTAPAIPAGNTHTVVAIADGYVGRYYDNGLTLKDGGATVIEVDTIALRKK